MGAVKIDMEKEARGYNVKYTLNDSAGVRALLGDRYKLSSARFTGDYAACDILLDLASVIEAAELTDKQAEALALVYGRWQLTQTEAAQAMGISQKNISKHLTEATEKMAARYQEWAYGEIVVEYEAKDKEENEDED